MNSYLIESSICLASFYGFYWLFLRGEKLLSVNRFYLVFTVLASILIPLLNFESQFAFGSSVEALVAKASSAPTGVSESAIESSPIITVETIYLFGVVISICILFFKLLIVKRKVGKWPAWQNSHIEIIETEWNDAYSFFNTIFIGKELNKNENLKQQIITHELAHIEGRHSLDLLLFEVLKCVYWFNPFSYLYAKSIRIQHEYIADDSVLKRTTPKQYERSLLQFALTKVNSSLISSFSEHPIQKRLKMIQKLNSNVMNKLKPLLALPILGLLFIAYACTDVAEPALVDELEEVVIDLKVEVEPDIVTLIPGNSDSKTIFEEEEIDISPVIEVIEGEMLQLKSIFNKRKLDEYIENTVAGSSTPKKFYVKTTDGRKLSVEFSENEIVEQPVSVKGVLRKKN